MIIPVRCVTCGKLLGDKWEEFKDRVKSGEKPSAVLDSMEIRRYCCRRMVLSHVDLLEDVIQFYEKKEPSTNKE